MKINRLSAGYFAGFMFGFVVRCTEGIPNIFLKVSISIALGVLFLFIADLISKPEYEGNKLNGEEVNLNGVSLDVEEDEHKIIHVSYVPKGDSIKLVKFLRTIISENNFILPGDKE
ncbi:MAG: hypothetical protein IKS93_01850 [Methanobrevibacter sp.]|nr:hypothetical protein [Methanobrevibacter sp.]